MKNSYLIFNKKDYNIDLPVLLIFFCRPEQFEKVFNEIKIARPSKLYLYQDGPRNEKDQVGIDECRKIVDDINWNCEVHQWYQEKNVGVDPSVYLAQKWMFEKEEYGVIIEDDEIPSQSLFPFCKELLEKYKYDERIQRISCWNVLEKNENCPYSYFFSTDGRMSGFATWKRIYDEIEPYAKFIDDEYFVNYYKNKFKNTVNIDIAKKFREKKIAFYEVLLDINLISNNRLVIIPTYNMIFNIGNCNVNSHGISNNNLLDSETRKSFEAPKYEINFPLSHPPYIFEDLNYNKAINKRKGNNKLTQLFRKIERIFLLIKYGKLDLILQKLKRNI